RSVRAVEGAGLGIPHPAFVLDHVDPDLPRRPDPQTVLLGLEDQRAVAVVAGDHGDVAGLLVPPDPDHADPTPIHPFTCLTCDTKRQPAYIPSSCSLLPKIHRSLAGHEREPRRGHGRWAMAVCRSRPVVRGHARRRRAGTTGRRGNHGGMTTTVPVTVDVEGPAGAGRVFGD